MEGNVSQMNEASMNSNAFSNIRNENISRKVTFTYYKTNYVNQKDKRPLSFGDNEFKEELNSDISKNDFEHLLLKQGENQSKYDSGMKLHNNVLLPLNFKLLEIPNQEKASKYNGSEIILNNIIDL